MFFNTNEIFQKFENQNQNVSCDVNVNLNSCKDYNHNSCLKTGVYIIRLCVYYIKYNSNVFIYMFMSYLYPNKTQKYLSTCVSIRSCILFYIFTFSKFYIIINTKYCLNYLILRIDSLNKYKPLKTNLKNLKAYKDFIKLTNSCEKYLFIFLKIFLTKS